VTQEVFRVDDNYNCPHLIHVVVESHNVKNLFSPTKVVSRAWADRQTDKEKLTGKLFVILFKL